MKSNNALLFPTLVVLISAAPLFAQDCSKEQAAVEKACSRGETSSICQRAKLFLERCLERSSGGGGGGGSSSEAPGTYDGEFVSTKLKNREEDCEVRTAIPGTVEILAGTKKNKLTGTFSDDPITLKGSKSKKGFELQAKQSAPGFKTFYKLTGSKLTETSVNLKYTKTRKRGKAKLCQAVYKATFERQ